jgi:hypothetical protein
MMLKIGRRLVLDREPVLLVLAPFAGHLSIVSEKPPFAPGPNRDRLRDVRFCLPARSAGSTTSAGALPFLPPGCLGQIWWVAGI